jgi:Fur family ferric uptake transcriptional regulator
MIKATRQRAAIASALEEAGGFRTAQEMHDHLLHEGAKVGLTTVYRTLQAMAASGEVDVLRNAEGEAIYRRCSTGNHHHHLVCRSCGHSVEIASTAVEEWAENSAERHGFTSVTHTAEVYGLCPGCTAVD